MGKLTFIKYLAPVWPKLVPKLKLLRTYWYVAHLIFRISRSRFWCQKLFSLNTYHLFDPNYPKIKSAQNLLNFGTFDISNMLISILMSKMTFMKYLSSVRPKLTPKIKNAQDLLKFGTFDISNILISILMSKIIFIKYVRLFRPKLVGKSKVLRI